MVRSCRACNGGLISSSGSPGECFGAGAAAPRRPQEDIFSTGFFQQVARRVCTPCSGKQADSNRDGPSNEASGLGVSEGALGGLKAASLGQQKAGGSGFRLGARNEGSSVPEAILQHGGHGPSTSSSKTATQHRGGWPQYRHDPSSWFDSTSTLFRRVPLTRQGRSAPPRTPCSVAEPLAIEDAASAANQRPRASRSAEVVHLKLSAR